MSTKADDRPLSETLTPVRRLLIIVAVMAATLMEVLDTSIVNVALPNMQGELGATLDQISWISTGYIIANVIVLPLTGWLSEFFGRRRYLLYSIVVFTLASLGCGMATTLPLLVAFRVLQGLGGAAFLSTGQATMMEIFPRDKQGLAQAIFGIGIMMGPTLGPALGGWLTDRFSWQWIFWVNVPVGIAAAILTAVYVVDSRVAHAKRAADWLGIALLAVGLGSLQTILERGERDDWFSAPYICLLAVASIVALALFIRRELRLKEPAVDIRVMRDRNLAAGSIFSLALGFALYGGTLLAPQFMQSVQTHTAEQAGLLLIPGGLFTALTMGVSGKLLKKLDPRLMVGLGMFVVGSSAILMADHIVVDAPDRIFFVPLMLRGIGLGLQFVPLSVVALGTLPPEKVGDAAGVFNLFRQLGGSFGIATLATVLDRREKLHYDRLATHLNPLDPTVQDRLSAMTHNFAAQGVSQPDAAAVHALAMQVGRQAADLSFMDAFRCMAYVCVMALVLLALFQKTRSNVAVAVH
jgi:MFS transporter, DHA2 family, multidrug resistance protein